MNGRRDALGVNLKHQFVAGLAAKAVAVDVLALFAQPAQRGRQRERLSGGRRAVFGLLLFDHWKIGDQQMPDAGDGLRRGDAELVHARRLIRRRARR